jgi:hypothetical protein
MAHHLMRNAGVAPEWIEADREVRRLLAERDRLRDAARRAGPIARRTLARRLGEVVAAHNRAVLVLNARAPTDRQHRRPLALDEELRTIDV